MITTKQRAHLRGLGNALEPLMQIGKEGVSENSLVAIEQVLQARELAKFKVLNNADCDAKELANEIAKKIGADVVQCIGKTFILYKKSTKKGFKHIELP
ncbi:MAG: ribosome assembly RNA-binding protein YhbY [Clostridia bacterium]|nr:ribosome assembly RNA-binding protein YhbY [Clostridia bacterium]